ncbi:MAG TPA: fatty acyl-AMP ligase [Stellaceae bacterium]|jgi:acyl-CoA synthetase (AMP-forming)/AMP-acid ligase II|nr:fatty acyl-AMP ligase [Stellaceae bacterium]
MSDETLVSRLLAHADHDPDRPLFIYLAESGAETGTLTRRDLAARSANLAAVLEQRVPASDNAQRLALLLFPTGPEFIVAYFACLMARIIAIPVPMPLPNRPLHGLDAIVESTRLGTALCAAANVETLGRALAATPRLAQIELLAIDALDAPAAAPRLPATEDVAFLQFTSGSTGRPKGVVVSHANLIANQRMITEGMALSADSTFVNWLPHFHDMGLIGTLLQPVYSGSVCYVMSPATFAKRPIRWLSAISGKPRAVGGSPNFGYDLCVSRIPEGQEAGLDLSGWDVAFTGAEPIHARTIDRFVERFAAVGFRRGAVYPCYGMSEVTLFAAGAAPGQGPVMRDLDRSALEHGTARPAAEGVYRAVSSGRLWPGQTIAIADPDTGARLPEGQIGEIWTAGAHVAGGYWGQPEATAEAFGARLAGEPDSPAFLRTGDFGFLSEGEVFVTGRRKEMMIVAGRNLYPHDLEEPAQLCHPDIRDTAVFAVDPDLAGERVVAVIEVEGESRQLLRNADPAAPPPAGLAVLARAVRGAVGAAFDIAVAQVWLVLPGRIPKTTSGKTQYGAIRRSFLDLPAAARSGELILQTGSESSQMR